MPRQRLILHAKAAADAAIRTAVETLRADGAELDVRVTWEPGDAARIAEEALQAGIETLIAGGGDGTLNEVITGLLTAHPGASADDLPSIALIPLGTANDFARNAGIPEDDLEAAFRIACQTRPIPIDIGRVGERYFVNVVTGGLGTEITVNTPEPLKKVLGDFAYLLTGLTHLVNIQCCNARITGPDFDFNEDFYGLAIGNGRFAGGGVNVAPTALLNDGLFHVNIVPDDEDFSTIHAMMELKNKGLSEDNDTVISTRLPWVQIEAPDGMQFNLDGEPIEATEIRFEVLPQRLRFHLPDTAPLV